MLKHEMPGTKLMIIDDLHPEDLAMLQALYSRSAESAETHLRKIETTGSGKFMESFYIKYNHKSIADCGSTTFFLEGVSMFAAKAVQDWPLYSGQETSTRFIDMSKQRIVDPVNSEASGRILATWMKFYTENQTRVSDEVRKRYPKKEGEADDAYAGAVKARTFDVLRGFLPSGICTQLSWHTNLRQAGDHLAMLARHPAKEIQTIGLHLKKLFAEMYPSSVGVAANAGVTGVTGNAALREDWETTVARSFTYPRVLEASVPAVGVRFYDTIPTAEMYKFSEILHTRPRGCVLPHFLSDLGQCSFSSLLDFGSFRDIQRHRNGVCRMPILTSHYGFEPWYLQQLDTRLQEEAFKLVTSLSTEIDRMTEDPIERQYYLPMGFRVPCHITYGLPATLYVLETRSSKTVHPTLRRMVQGMSEAFSKRFPHVALHVDKDVDDWTVRRGTQTITAK